MTSSQATADACKRAAPPRRSLTNKNIVADTNPSIITPTAGPSVHPIYGSIPMGRNGFALECQPVHMLDHWHKKADEICQKFNEPGDKSEEDEALFEMAMIVAWDIFRSALKAKLYNSREVSILLALVARHIDTHTGDDCEVLSVKELASIADKARLLTEPPRPTKVVGALQRGTRLTRSGLLHRYHAFLVNELLSVGLELYGNHKYPLTSIPFEDPVQDVCARRTGRGKSYPFHDQSKLTDRARAVFKKLGIDASSAPRDRVPAKGAKALRAGRGGSR
ncbi:hypothetical protein SAMN03159423_4499 [Bradyrhizobium sp. NFR13]|uniref:hypothetical protein n=1 Tax=Bradyrhizobium sp. NFR13 TaxID=1566285 RepID=UPI0008F0B07A|nr:hypothetical protein [Bradyrhizobium sp. NFR13]SFL93440.1 hypothetical protein SAMN03159423_4499 [Bradyrhizobium sp. NFR13]